MNELDRLNDAQKAQLGRLCDMLLAANARTNLTAITDEREVWLKHFADSLAALPLLTPGARVLDEGCGAGFPSLPLKIAEPSLRMTLVDSVAKKIAFVRRVVEELGLDGVEARHSRIEEIPERDYDFVVARAVAKLATLAEYALPFLRVGGRLVAYKAADVDDELAAAQPALAALGGRVAEVREIRLGEDLLRKLIVVEKLRPTPARYPRPRNLPRTRPL